MVSILGYFPHLIKSKLKVVNGFAAIDSQLIKNGLPGISNLSLYHLRHYKIFQTDILLN